MLCNVQFILPWSYPNRIYNCSFLLKLRLITTYVLSLLTASSQSSKLHGLHATCAYVKLRETTPYRREATWPKRSFMHVMPWGSRIQITPALGPKVCKYYLHWVIWIPWMALTKKRCSYAIGSYVRLAVSRASRACICILSPCRLSLF